MGVQVELKEIRTIAAGEVHSLCVQELGLASEDVDLEAPEALAALVRRAASLLAPCGARALRATVLRSLRGLAGAEKDSTELRDSVDGMIEALTAYGDLLELPTWDSDHSGLRLLYLAPPTFVPLGDALYILGGALDGIEAVPSDLRAAIEYRSHTRRLRPKDLLETAHRLRAVGWVELPSELWRPPPRRQTPAQLVADANRALASSPSNGEVPGLVVLDTQRSTTNYRARWTEPGRLTGNYVARREQRYGADLWSYVELVNGAVSRLVDLPLRTQGEVRPCDAAWHLQMALDSTVGRPQRYRLRPDPPTGRVLVDFFSPVPLWARRRWDVVGEQIAARNSLLTYSFPSGQFTDVDDTLHSHLWLRASESL